MDVDLERWVPCEAPPSSFVAELGLFQVVESWKPKRHGSTDVWLLRTAAGLVVLRRPLDADPKRWRARNKVLQRVSNYLPVALPMLYDGKDFMEERDGLWEMYPWIHGRHLNYRSPTELRAAARYLSKLHSTVEVKEADAEALPVKIRRVQDSCTGLQDTLRWCESEAPEAIRIATLKLLSILQSLENVEIPMAETGRQYVCHGEIGPSNLLVSNGRLVSAIDWDSLHIGSRLYDLVWGVTTLCRKNADSFEVDPLRVRTFLAEQHTPLASEEMMLWNRYAISMYLPTPQALASRRATGWEGLGKFLTWCLRGLAAVSSTEHSVLQANAYLGASSR